MEQRQVLDISWGAVIKVLIAGFVFYILFSIRHIIIWFFFALIISLLLDPAILFLKKFYIPKVVAVILVYLSLFLVLGLVVYLTAPIFIFEIHQFSQHIPEYFEKVNPWLRGFGFNVADSFQEFAESLLVNLQEGSRSIIKAISLFFGGISSTVLIFVFAFYISLEEKGVERVIALLVPKRYEERMITLFERAQIKVASWFGARLLACLFVGVLSLLILFVFQVKYSFILALVSGVLNFIPFIGPLLTALLVALFVGVSDSWMTAVYLIIALMIIQEIENKLLTPLLMKKFLDLPPVLVLVSILIGGTFFGLLGVLLIVPIAGIIYEILKEFFQKRKEEASYEKAIM